MISPCHSPTSSLHSLCYNSSTKWSAPWILASRYFAHTSPHSLTFLFCIFPRTMSVPLKTAQRLFVVFSSSFQPINRVLNLSCTLEPLGKLWTILMPGLPTPSLPQRSWDVAWALGLTYATKAENCCLWVWESSWLIGSLELQTESLLFVFLPSFE